MKRFIDLLASARLTVVLLVILSVLVVWGTLYQASNGLYAAQERFYSSMFFLALGFFPFPGARLVLALLFLNLLCAMFVSLKYRWRRAGSIITHAGLLVFLLGGFIIGLYTRESSLTLLEGEGANVAVSYQEWELAAWAPDAVQRGGMPPRTARPVTAVTANRLRPGAALKLGETGLSLAVESYFRNAEPVRAAPGEEDPPLNSAGFAGLRERPLETEPGANLPGGFFVVTTPDGASRRLLLYGGDPQPTRIEAGGRAYDLVLQRRREPLPFVVVLDDFQREMHPQSNMPRSFASEVTVLSQDAARSVRIAMNEPLRYRGFTLYQSSYRELDDGREFSTFAVVRNRGRYLPYAGTLIVFAGLMTHFLIVIFERRARPA